MEPLLLSRASRRCLAGIVTATVAASCGGSPGGDSSSGGSAGESTASGATTGGSAGSGATTSGSTASGATAGSIATGATTGSTSGVGATGVTGSGVSAGPPGSAGATGSMASGATTGSMASGATTGSMASGATTGSTASGVTGGSSAGGAATGATSSGAAAGSPASDASGGSGDAGVGPPSDGGAYKSRYVFSVSGTKTLLNGQALIAKGFRVSNALVTDAATNALIAQFDTYVSYGLNIVSVYLQGSRYTKVVGYLPDASLDPTIAARMGRIIEAADARGMIVLVGCLYYGGAGSTQPNWTQTDADNAIANTTRWARSHNYRNVFFDPDNEGMASTTFSDPELVQSGKTGDPNAVMASNHGACAPAADLCIHISQMDPAKPYIETEGGGIWNYGTGNYVASSIGVYTATQEQARISAAQNAYKAGQGWMLSSMWLQAAPPLGPNPNFGGDGINMPGVAWWADWVKTTYGAYVPPPPMP